MLRTRLTNTDSDQPDTTLRPHHACTALEALSVAMSGSPGKTDNLPELTFGLA